MRRLVIVMLSMACTAMLTTGATAADTVLRDSLGRRVGTVEKDITTDNLVIRDNLGRIQGRVEKDAAGRDVLRDRLGRSMGTVEHPDRSGWSLKDLRR